MRTDYRLASKSSGFIKNIFSFNEKCTSADNFIAVEILYFLARNRKITGGIGLEGYFTYPQIVDEMQVYGYDPKDILLVLSDLLSDGLISNDRMSSAAVKVDDALRITAAGYIHIRILTGRFEYLFGVLPETPILDQQVASQIGSWVKMEIDRGDIDIFQKGRAVDTFYRYLWKESQTVKTPFRNEGEGGAAYVLQHMLDALSHTKNVRAGQSNDPDALDS